MSDERVLMCALAVDTFSHVDGCIGGYQCADCGAEIVIAKSGQRMLQRQPSMKTICVQCGIKSAKAGQVSSTEIAPGAVEELINDIVKRRSKHSRN